MNYEIIDFYFEFKLNVQIWIILKVILTSQHLSLKLKKKIAVAGSFNFLPLKEQRKYLMYPDIQMQVFLEIMTPTVKLDMQLKK